MKAVVTAIAMSAAALLASLDTTPAEAGYRHRGCNRAVQWCGPYPKWNYGQRDFSRRMAQPRNPPRPPVYATAPIAAPAADCCERASTPMPPRVDKWALICACLGRLGLAEGADFYSRIDNGEPHAILTAPGHMKVRSAGTLAQAAACVKTAANHR